MKMPCVYILTNRPNGTRDTGVTSNLSQRVFQHKQAIVAGFTKRYGCKILVWYENHERMDEAIAREKQIKAGSRANKIGLIMALNANWQDLYQTLA